jgi:hypothetical protein
MAEAQEGRGHGKPGAAAGACVFTFAGMRRVLGYSLIERDAAEPVIMRLLSVADIGFFFLHARGYALPVWHIRTYAIASRIRF